MRRLLPLLLAVCVPFVQNAVDARRGRYQAQEEVLYLWSGQHVRRLVPGLEDLFADIYWLRTVQYFGGQRVFTDGKKFDLLGPLVDITTTLDPSYTIAYRYGAVFMAEPAPSGAGQPEKGVELLKRGALANPSSWQIRQDWGFFVYFFLQNAVEASEILSEASRIPGAPDWLRSSAADFLMRSGERDTSRHMWQHLYEQAEGPMRDNARFNLDRLDAADAVDVHQRAVTEFRARLGRFPTTLQELSGVGLLRAPLLDPAKVPFNYDPATGAVTLSRKSYLWRAT